MKRTEIAQLLPGVFQRTLAERGAEAGHPLEAMLAAMEALHARAEAVLSDVDRLYNPDRTSDALVPFLARWVDLERLFPPSRGVEPSEPIASGLGRLRQLVAAGAFLTKWRGTRQGLVRFLETATGMGEFSIEENPPGPDGKPRSFHLLVRAPAEAERLRCLIERIVDVERPAWCTWELSIPTAT